MRMILILAAIQNSVLVLVLIAHRGTLVFVALFAK